jgi:hypothetical protein
MATVVTVEGPLLGQVLCVPTVDSGGRLRMGLRQRALRLDRA